MKRFAALLLVLGLIPLSGFAIETGPMSETETDSEAAIGYYAIDVETGSAPNGLEDTSRVIIPAGADTSQSFILVDGQIRENKIFTPEDGKSWAVSEAVPTASSTPEPTGTGTDPLSVWIGDQWFDIPAVLPVSDSHDILTDDGRAWLEQAGYNDLQDASHLECIAWASSRGLMVGCNKIQWQPSRAVNRSEMTAITLRLIDFWHELKLENQYTDNPDDAWHHEIMVFGSDIGFIPGMDGTTCDPNSDATLGDVLYCLERVVPQYDTHGTDTIMDHGMALARRVFGEQVSETDTVTRGQMARLLHEYVQEIVWTMDQMQWVLENQDRRAIVVKAPLSLTGVTILGSLVYADSVDGNAITLTDCVIEGPFTPWCSGTIQVAGNSRLDATVLKNRACSHTNTEVHFDLTATAINYDNLRVDLPSEANPDNLVTWEFSQPSQTSAPETPPAAPTPTPNVTVSPTPTPTATPTPTVAPTATPRPQPSMVAALLYDYDNALMDTVVIDVNGDVAKQLDTHVRNKLVHPDLRNADPASTSDRDNYRGRWKGYDAKECARYPMTNHIGYRVMEGSGENSYAYCWAACSYNDYLDTWTTDGVAEGLPSQDRMFDPADPMAHATKDGALVLKACYLPTDELKDANYTQTEDFYYTKDGVIAYQILWTHSRVTKIGNEYYGVKRMRHPHGWTTMTAFVSYNKLCDAVPQALLEWGQQDPTRTLQDAIDQLTATNSGPGVYLAWPHVVAHSDLAGVKMHQDKIQRSIWNSCDDLTFDLEFAMESGDRERIAYGQINIRLVDTLDTESIFQSDQMEYRSDLIYTMDGHPRQEWLEKGILKGTPIYYIQGTDEVYMAIVQPKPKTPKEIAQMLLDDIQQHTALYYAIREGLVSKDRWPTEIPAGELTERPAKFSPHSYFNAAHMLNLETNDHDHASIHQDWQWGGKLDEFSAFIHTYCMDIITNHTREPGWWDFDKDLPMVDYHQLCAYWDDFNAWWRDPNWDGSNYPSVPSIEAAAQVYLSYCVWHTDCPFDK